MRFLCPVRFLWRWPLHWFSSDVLPAQELLANLPAWEKVLMENIQLIPTLFDQTFSHRRHQLIPLRFVLSLIPKNRLFL